MYLQAYSKAQIHGSSNEGYATYSWLQLTPAFSKSYCSHYFMQSYYFKQAKRTPEVYAFFGSRYLCKHRTTWNWRRNHNQLQT